MRKFLLSLVFAITAIAVQAQEPAVVMTTSKSINSQFSFGISANAANTPIQIDWGNGVKENFTIGDATEFFSYPLEGSSVKIWGTGIASLNIDSKELTALDLTRATSLTYLYCKSNQLTTLDLSNCNALKYVDCSYNQLTSLNLPTTSTLVAINCENNLLTSLNVSGAPSIRELICRNNKLTFFSLPLKQTTWTTYTYHPQQSIALPKQTYSINEEVDLSSYLNVNGNTTTYTWKTKAGIILASGTDYAATGGKFTFLKTYADSLLCEMENTTFPSLALSTKCIAIPQTPSVVMTTTNTIGSEFSFLINATENNTLIQVDWGNGAVANYTIGSNSTVSGTLAGNTIKIYGMNISMLRFESVEIITLDVSKCTSLSSLTCQYCFKLTTIELSDSITNLWLIANKLTYIDVSKNTLLKDLTISQSPISSIDISNNTKLTSLNLSHTEITNVDLTKQLLLKIFVCTYSKINTLDLSKNTLLKNLFCTGIKINTLDVSTNSALTMIECSENQLTTLDVSQNTSLIYLRCVSNKLTYATLPIKQATWTTYTYSPQAKVTLAKKEYSINEEIDISDQLITGDNTTTYVWKTINGVTMIKDVDYTESNGKFTFKIPPVGYFYCEMKNATFPDLTLTTENIFITPTTPGIIMNTTNSIGTTLSFQLSANENNNSIHIDWGDGVLHNYTIQWNMTPISGKLAGGTIKVYGWEIRGLTAETQGLYSLDVSNCPKLEVLWCGLNKLTNLDLTKNSSLRDLYCGFNNITSLDISKNTSLQNFQCSENLIAEIDLSNNTILSRLSCDNNKLKRLDLSRNLNLKTLTCYSNEIETLNILYNTKLEVIDLSSNRLTYNTLPIKKAEWTTYHYGQQARLPLPKSEYAINEEIDLSSQLTTGGNTTVYTWKTKGGITLVKDVDYSENNGKFKFLKQIGDYFYCEMKNATFPDLTLNTENILITITEPILTITTSTPVNTQFNFILRANSSNDSIKIDWGNGDLTDYVIRTENSNISGKLVGNTIKVYGYGITYADLSNKNINSLILNNNPVLKHIFCKSNKLVFSSLPLKLQTWTTYTYNPQNSINLSKKQYGLSETVDLSSELTVDGKTTNYIWKTKGGTTLTAGTDYSVTGGVTTFLKVQTDSVYCQMTNATFPDLTLSTTNIKVSQFPLSVSQNGVAVKVYPNPATDIFNLEMADDIVKVEVYTITGVKVFENGLYNSTKVNVPLTNVPKGTLIVKAYTRNGVYENKVIKI